MKLCSLVLLLFSTFSTATNIKWHQTKVDPKDPAQNAPKSQKYWDEHNIERPDYAKTDAEVAAERGQTAALDPFSIVLLLVLAGVAGFAWKFADGGFAGGTRLGSTGRVYRNEEDARKARLAHFEQKFAMKEE